MYELPKLKDLDRTYLPIRNLLMAGIPSFETAATGMMKETMKKKGVASIEELRELAMEAEVKMVACQMTVDLFGHEKSDFIDGISEWVGAASFLPIAQKADVNLFV